MDKTIDQKSAAQSWPTNSPVFEAARNVQKKSKRFLIHEARAALLAEDFRGLPPEAFEIQKNSEFNPTGNLAQIKISNISQVQSPLSLYGRIFRGSSDKTIILIHGFTQNYWSMGTLALSFQQKGLNVIIYNHPGYGLEGETSTSPAEILNTPGRNPYAVAELPVALDQVVSFAEQIFPKTKIFLFGYSMGGLTVHQYISGTYGSDDLGQPLRNPKLAQNRQQRVAGIIAGGAPDYDLSGASNRMQKVNKINRKVIKKLSSKYPKSKFISSGFGGNLDNFEKYSRLTRTLQKLSEFKWGVYLANQILFTLGDIRHFGAYQKDLKNLFRWEFCSTTVGNLISVSLMSQLKACPPIENPSTPQLELGGSLDHFSNVQKFIQRFRHIHSKNPQSQLIVIEGLGHLPMILPTGLDLYFEHMMNFINLAGTDQFLQLPPEIYITYAKDEKFIRP